MSRAEWLAARRELLVREKQLARECGGNLTDWVRHHDRYDDER